MGLFTDFHFFLFPLASSKKKELWNKDTKTNSKDFDEMLEQTRAKPLSPTNVEKKKQVPYEGGTVHFFTSFKIEDSLNMFVFICLCFQKRLSLQFYCF